MMASAAVYVDLAACEGVSGVVAPRLLLPDANYTCANTPAMPIGAFRMIYSPDGVRLDTTARYVNRHLEPHRSADTVVIGTKQGQGLLVFRSGGDSSTYCVTVYDSLIHHLPNARGDFPVP